MLPGMAAKPNIAIVGAGNLGTALAVSLKRAGYPIESVIARPKSLKKRQTLARQVGARARLLTSPIKADLVWFCVPDSEIRTVAESFARNAKWKGRVALHSSGALTSDELNSLRKLGSAVASVHPLMTFVARSHPVLAGVPFAIEGDAAAVRSARKIVRDLGGEPYAIPKRAKAAYHAWGTFASPLLTALLATNEEVARVAGVSRSDARRRVIPILLQTLANYARFGATQGLSGPIIRGDRNTVERHLKVLESVPVAREVYRSLANASLKYLPARHKQALRRILASAPH